MFCGVLTLGENIGIAFCAGQKSRYHHFIFSIAPRNSYKPKVLLHLLHLLRGTMTLIIAKTIQKHKIQYLGERQVRKLNIDASSPLLQNDH